MSNSRDTDTVQKDPHSSSVADRCSLEVEAPSSERPGQAMASEVMSRESSGVLSEREIQPGREEEVALLGWRKKSSSVSLQSANASVRVPDSQAAWYKQWAAYIGVGFMVSVG